ncbi:MAG: diaminopimelate decarboxylase [Bacteroidales bacterium]|nr:diaminopimelate decarboxylase [Bacteroidales bacterium]
MATRFPLERFAQVETPFYYYDLDVLRLTLDTVVREAAKHDFVVHYAVKANANPRLLNEIRQAGLGIDCVSGGEVRCALEHGFDAKKIVFAGVGKSDWEIDLALDADIECLNVESIPEMEVINERAMAKGRVADICLRVNPNVDAHTHQYITTGMEENKFGIGLWEVEAACRRAEELPCINLVGFHFHIGSQITDMSAFQVLCTRVNELLRWAEEHKINLSVVNVGGGLGVDYEHPDEMPLPDFADYFSTFARHLELRSGQQVHFELGRSIVAQCGSLVTKVLYVKKGQKKQFAVVDAGMNDLIRPALYHAYHKIENISSALPVEKYDVVGPVCESSDCFGKEIQLPAVSRGDLIALRSAGAYGETMASRYNLRKFAQGVYSD